MRKKLLIGLVLSFFVVGLFAAVSCTKKVMNSESSMGKEETAVPALVQSETAEAEKAPAEVVRNEESPSAAPSNPEQAGLIERGGQARPDEARKEAFPGELVLFEFDSSILTGTAQDYLKRKAQWLSENPHIAIVIEGHCDERGSTSYNLALGERRAQAAKSMLVDLGVPAGRLATVSYGEEHPFVSGHDEGAWSLNRRAHFVLKE